MKKFMAMLCLLVAGTMAFGYGGYMESATDIRYVSTQWFDIIFPAESADSAYTLSQQADDIYVDICATMGFKPMFRLPVVITRETDIYNAYYTSSVSNHIVLFDTMPDEEMAVSEESFISTFRHELDHAVTLNYKDASLQLLTSILGDVYNVFPAYFIPSMFIEGAAVSSESLYGQGRLNDEYYLHMERQAKLMGDFPSWSTALGGPDTFPGGSMCYGFGGPFTKWLQDNYGMQRFADFWYKGCNTISLGLPHLFYKSYGVTIGTAWAAYRDSIQVPDIPADPVTLEGVSEYIKAYGNRFVNVVSYEGGIAFVDAATNSIWIASENADGTFNNPSKLMSNMAMGTISASPDGKYIIYSSIDLNNAAYRNILTVIESATGKTFTLEGTGYSDGSIFELDGNYYLCASKIDAQYETLELFELKLAASGSIESAEKIMNLPLAKNDCTFSICGGHNGSFALIYKEGLEWSIREYNLEKSGDMYSLTVDKIAAPVEGMRIRYLNRQLLDDGRTAYSFSYTTPSKFPRYGVLYSSNGEYEYELMEQELSGGVYSSALSSTGNLVYSAYFVKECSLLNMDTSAFDFASYRATSQNVASALLEEKADHAQIDSFLADSLEYDGLKFNTRGYFTMEYGALPYYSITRTGLLENYGSSSIGVARIMGTPWDSETYTVSAGYDPLLSTVAVGAGIQGTNPSDTFSYSLKGTLVANLGRTNIGLGEAAGNSLFMTHLGQANVNAYLGYTLYTGDHSYIVLRNQTFGFIGQIAPSYDVMNNALVIRDKINYLLGEDDLSLNFGYVNRVAAGPYGAVSALLSLNTYVKGSLALTETSSDSVVADVFWKHSDDYKTAYEIGFTPSVGFQAPLLPVNTFNVNGISTNLPLSVQLSVLPSSQTIGRGSAELMLADWEIQKGFGYVPLFLNRICLTASYNAMLISSTVSCDWIKLLGGQYNFANAELKDYATLNLAFLMRPNSGNLARSDPSVLNFSLKYNINGYNGESPFEFAFGETFHF